jgi:hypothetical protein
LPELEREEEQQRQDSDNEDTPAVLAFDFPGVVTLAIATASLLAAIDLQNTLSWGHPLVFSLIILGILSTVAFLIFETFPGNRELLMPLELLRTEIGAFCAGQVLRILFTLCIPLHSLNVVLEPQIHRFIGSSPHGSRINILTLACGLATYSFEWLWGT